MTAIESPAQAPPVPPEVDAGTRWSRWSDLLNPILVREVQQAIKGRAFVLTVFLALGIGVVIAIAAASQQQLGRSGGRMAFDAGLATLVPLLGFVVPMGAYQSMRLELRGGIVEQLMLSELRPWRIIVGKLCAAMVQFVLYVAVLAPLLATSYLLRGVDLPTIGLSLLFALLFCVAATSFAISSAAQGMLPAMQGLANLGVAFGLGVASFSGVAFVGSGEYVRDLGWLIRSRELGMVTSLVACIGLSGSVLSGLIAQSFLAHAFENRSTGFRVFLFAMVGFSYGWLCAFVDPADWHDASPAITWFLVLLGAGFAIFMTTEQQVLSPRVRAHVPRSPLLAALAAPLLPGRDRGMACLVLYLGLVGAIGWSLWPVTGPGRFLSGLARALAFTTAYVLIYLTIGKALRGRLPPTVAGNHIARFLVPFAVFVFCIAPVLLDVMVRGDVRNWHIGHVMNPFWTIDQFAWRHERGSEVLWGVVAAGIGALALQVPGMIRGWLEVQRASALRRQAPAAKVANGEPA